MGAHTVAVPESLKVNSAKFHLQCTEAILMTFALPIMIPVQKLEQQPLVLLVILVVMVNGHLPQITKLVSVTMSM